MGPLARRQNAAMRDEEHAPRSQLSVWSPRPAACKELYPPGDPPVLTLRFWKRHAAHKCNMFLPTQCAENPHQYPLVLDHPPASLTPAEDDSSARQLKQDFTHTYPSGAGLY